jgi:hypothetical protein
MEYSLPDVEAPRPPPLDKLLRIWHTMHMDILTAATDAGNWKDWQPLLAGLVACLVSLADRELHWHATQPGRALDLHAPLLPGTAGVPPALPSFSLPQPSLSLRFLSRVSSSPIP